MNTIALRIFDFLKHYPPFNMIDEERLLTIANAIEIKHFESKDFVFSSAEPVTDYFYIVKDGAIGLYRDTNNELVDKCDEGDIFGLRALIRQGNYQLNAQAIEESIIYCISSDLLYNYITIYNDVNRFLLRTFISNSTTDTLETWYKEPLKKDQIVHFNEEQSANYSKNPIVCSPETSIKIAAEIMTMNHVGSIVVTDNRKPIGIITDKDLRIKIATGIVSIDDSVTKIMSSPVITYPDNISVAEAQIAMLQNNITHLCITEDGTDKSALTGILSEHDVLVIREHSASNLVKAIKRAKTILELRDIRKRSEALLVRYLEQKLPMTFVSKIITSINVGITKRTIDLVLASINQEPPVDFAWLSIGSQGRQEQLLLTDQDNFIVFDTVKSDVYERTKQYFLDLAGKITTSLNTIGFEFCPADMMASNPKWCLSIDQWQAQFKSWITKPDQDNLMLCTIFFDFEIVYGSKALSEQLAKSIFSLIDSNDIFLNYLGMNALQNPPPLSFFRNFLVESSGDHKDQFDIKSRAMMPMVDAARLLILSKGIPSHNSTISRYEKLLELEPQNKDIYEACILAFEDLLRFRTEQGLRNNNSGRFIDLQSLSKANKLELKSSFKAIKDIQELIRTRFKLSQLF